MEIKELSLAKKLQMIKVELGNSSLKKTGKNAFAGFEYFELKDFLPTIIELCSKYNVFTYVSFTKDLGTLTAVNSDNLSEVFVSTSPLVTISQKGCNEIQALGSVETYTRRYLYLAMFDIVEDDGFDKISGRKETKPTYTNNQPSQSNVVKPNVVKPEVKREPKPDLSLMQGEPIQDSTLTQLYALDEILQKGVLRKCKVDKLGDVNETQAQYILLSVQKSQGGN